jgi:hypothetical protein
MATIEPELITIIEGPPPDFRPAMDSWLLSLSEGAVTRPVAACQMRAFDAEALVERCRRAWGEGRPVRLDFPSGIGLRRQADILAARAGQVEAGDVLLLWVRLPDEADADK